jgi:hypothetical protein
MTVSDSSASGPHDALTLQTELPVAFIRDDPAGRPRLPGDTLYNLRILQAYDVLEEHAHLERTESDNPVIGDIRRLDTKLNLLLQLFGEIIKDRKQPPYPEALRLDRTGVEWSPLAPVAAGATGTVEIFVHPSIPLPIRWRAIAAAPSEAGQQRFACEPLSALEADQLERLIFLAHRQQVADSRRHRA